MSKILITGGTGLVGKALEIECNKIDKINTLFFVNSKICDLTDNTETYKLFEKIKPDYVIHLAACVGGLYKNMNYKVDMLEKNISINSNVLKCCHIFNVKKCISCLSTCIFPDNITYPINETMLHNGPPHNSNNTYAYAKRILEIHSKAYQEQYNRDFICIIPTNIYGPYDNFNLEDAHVIPALIHRCYLAKKNKEPFIVKGSGKPLRQFIYSNDVAKLIIWVLEKYHEKESIILSTNKKDEVSIKNIAFYIAECFDYKDHIVFDSSYSDGQYKKTADNSKLMKLLETSKESFEFTDIKEGIETSVKWFIDNYEECRK